MGLRYASSQPTALLSDADIADFLARMEAELDLTRGEMTMFTLDMPNEPPRPPMVVVAQAAPVQVERTGKMRAMGICATARSNPGTPLHPAEYSPLDPRYAAESYFFIYENGKRVAHFDEVGRHIPLPLSAIKLIAPPKHGQFSDGPDGFPYMYMPDLDFVGDDKVIFEVTVEGMPVRVVVAIKVRENLGDEQYGEYCKVDRWKISTAPADTPEYTLSAVIAGLLDGPAPHVADLPGLATGQTIGSQITLDTNAAGYTWYIDFTPLDNTDDYLPTADPTIWKAKPGRLG